MSPSIGVMLSCHTSLSSVPNRSPSLVLFGVIFASLPCLILWGPYRMSCCFVPSVLCAYFSDVLLLFLRALGLSLCLPGLLLVFCPRTRCPISFVVPLFSPCLWLRPLLFLLPLLRLMRALLLPLLLLLLLLIPSVRIWSGPWLRLRPLLVMFLSHPFLKRPLGVPLPFLHRFIYGTSSLNLLGDFLLDLLLLRVLLCDFLLFYIYVLKFVLVYMFVLSVSPVGGMYWFFCSTGCVVIVRLVSSPSPLGS